MEIRENDRQLTWFIRLATVVLVVTVLRVAQEVLLPIAFAALLSFLLSPLVMRLKRWGLPKGAAIVAAVTIAFAALGGVGWLVTSQAIALIRELPNYEENLHRKIAALKHPHGSAMVGRMGTMVERLQRDLQASPVQHPAPAAQPPSAEPKPVPVEVKATDTSTWQVVRDLASPVLRPLGVAGIVIVFVVAMLFQREDLRDRVIRLVSAGQLNVATQALDDAASRVSRYLGMQLVVNATYGVPVGVGLYFIGIPNALLWGLVATLLRFIPFIGPWIAAAFPVSLALAVDPGWMKLVYVIGLFVVMELISNNIVEVIVYGATTGISNLALLVAAVFWTWLWGPAGLVLSTPLTVCLLVLGKYVPGLDFLKMLLGTEPVLEPPAQLYQRMLSMESEDMLDLASNYIEQHSLEEFYEDVFVPALLMSEEDRHRGDLPPARQQFIAEASLDLVEELERAESDAMAETEEASASDSSEELAKPALPRVLVVPARDQADAVVAAMLCHLLRRRHVPAAMQALGTPIESTSSVLDKHATDIVIVSALPPSAVSAARQVCRQIRARQPSLPIVAGVWRHTSSLAELQGRLRVPRLAAIVSRLSEAMTAVEQHMPAGMMTDPPARPKKPLAATDASPLTGGPTRAPA
jgi:predicted PurR-regulated permease PerM